jgi:hypothetical protein
VAAPNGDDVLPLPNFDPSIGEFRFAGHDAVLQRAAAGGYFYAVQRHFVVLALAKD